MKKVLQPRGLVSTVREKDLENRFFFLGQGNIRDFVVG